MNTVNKLSVNMNSELNLSFTRILGEFIGVDRLSIDISWKDLDKSYTRNRKFLSNKRIRI